MGGVAPPDPPPPPAAVVPAQVHEFAGTSEMLHPTSWLRLTGVPPDSTETSIRNIFSEYGTVLSAQVLPCSLGMHNTEAVVQMGNVEVAEWLVENVNNNIPEGLSSPIQISFSSTERSMGATGGFNCGSLGQPDDGSCHDGLLGSGAARDSVQSPWSTRVCSNNVPSEYVYMKGFAPEIDELTLRTMIAPYGTILTCRVLPPPPNMTCAAAIAQMSNISDAKWLVDHLNGTIPDGHCTPIEVKYS